MSPGDPASPVTVAARGDKLGRDSDWRPDSDLTASMPSSSWSGVARKP